MGSIGIGLLLLNFSAANCSAQQFGLFTYSVSNGEVTIVDYPRDAVGHVEIPAEIESLPVALIGRNAFNQCESITSVTIPGSVRSIGEQAFWICSGLTSLDIPEGVGGIGRSAFAACIGITSLSLPDSLRIIDASAFAGCSGLTGLALPSTSSGLTIRSDAFSSCTGLSAVAIPASVERIGNSPFAGCSNLTGITVDAANPGYADVDGVLFDKEISTLIQFPGAKSGDYVIPLTVNSIGPSAFANCQGSTSLTIPDRVTSVGRYAFFGFGGLESVTIGRGLAIESSTFSHCRKLSALNAAPGHPVYASLNGVLLSRDRSTLIRFPLGRSGHYTIPAGVTTIADEAFQSCWEVQSITMPDHVTAIGIRSFLGCGMETLTLGSGITVIPERAFAGCRSLTTLSIPATVTEIGPYAFSSCESLTSLTLSEGLATIGSGAFELCPNLTALRLPQSLTTIYGNAFRRCRGLTSLTIPALVTSIDLGAFKSCEGLTSLQFDPGSPVSISSDVFNGCTNLAEIDFADRVQSIGTRAFLGCSRLSEVTLGSRVESIGKSAFSGCTGLAEVTLNSGGDLRIDDGAFSECSGINSVTFPDGLTALGAGAFSACTGLTRAVFLGDAPRMGDEDQESGNVFIPAAPGFTVFYLSSSVGFTTPTWRIDFDDDEFDEYPTSVIDEAVYPAASWLITHGFPLETDLHQDLNGDDVTLLMAYALDLDPHLNLRGSLPGPAFEDGILSLSFYGASQAISYRVEASTGLRNWTSEGVMLSEPDAEGLRSAMVSQGSAARFLRLVVAEQASPP